MICALSFIDGRVHFHSKYVATHHHLEEEKKKQFVYMGQMGTRNKHLIRDSMKALFSIATGKSLNLQFRNPSNTNVFFWGGKVGEFMSITATQGNQKFFITKFSQIILCYMFAA